MSWIDKKTPAQPLIFFGRLNRDNLHSYTPCVEPSTCNSATSLKTQCFLLKVWKWIQYCFVCKLNSNSPHSTFSHKKRVKVQTQTVCKSCLECLSRRCGHAWPNRSLTRNVHTSYAYALQSKLASFKNNFSQRFKSWKSQLKFFLLKFMYYMQFPGIKIYVLHKRKRKWNFSFDYKFSLFHVWFYMLHQCIYIFTT